MEQHPVPQNVTTFQFRLIGDMTIKQFGYLAGGLILAYISYKLPLPFFFTYPLTALFALGGIGFAFVPIEERPMDVWVLSFFKNVYNPTQFVWQQQAAQQVQPAAHPTPVIPVQPHAEPKLSTVPSQPVNETHPTAPTLRPAIFTAGGQQHTAPVAHEHQMPVVQPKHQSPKKQSGPSIVDQITTMISSLFAPKKQTQQAPHYTTGTLLSATPVTSVTGKPFHAPTLPSQQLTQKTEPEHKAPEQKTAPVKNDDHAKALEERIEGLKKDLEVKEATDTRILELQKQLTDTLAEREKMQKELSILRTQMQRGGMPQSPFGMPNMPGMPGGMPLRTAPAYAPPVAPAQPTVRVVGPDAATKAGLPRLTTYPNIVTGIVKDDENNLLPGVLVTVRDKEDIPLRALKSNKLGQFAASTQLPNGTYFIEIEDPRKRYHFDRAQITLNDTILPAIEIVARSQKQVDREKLAKQIFGDQVK